MCLLQRMGIFGRFAGILAKAFRSCFANVLEANSKFAHLASMIPLRPAFKAGLSSRFTQASVYTKPLTLSDWIVMDDELLLITSGAASSHTPRALDRREWR